jgi:16S rRNA (guanine527-N7)-methyltransferase
MSELSSLTLPALPEVWQSTLSWSPTEPQQEQFQLLLTQLCALNEGVNLTRITSPEAFWEKHLWDSLWGVQPWLNAPPHALRVIDIGTGGGFPGIPVAITFPAWQLTLLDSTRKKIACLDTLCQTVPIANAHPVCDRAEVLAHHGGDRAAYDIALIRAVGSVSCCAEYALPFLKVGGTAVVYRGQWSLEEEQALQQALLQLGGELSNLRSTSTPLTQGKRHCLYLHKAQPTPATFPRKTGLPAQHPLGA